MNRVVVCGGRHYNDYVAVWDALDIYHPKFLATGACPTGADRWAEAWASGRPYEVEYTPYPADWETYGRAAGPKRNQQILDEFKPDLVLAFPGGRGTMDMVKRAKKAGVLVEEPVP